MGENTPISVVAKFRVQAIRRATISHSKQVQVVSDDGKSVSQQWVPEKQEIQTIEMIPVYDADPESENGRFWDATPVGKIELGTINEAAGRYFDLDGEYYVTFTHAPKVPGK
jgi:hypothetical protein